MKKRLLIILFVIFFVALLALLAMPSLRYIELFQNQMRLREWVRHWGAWAPLAIVLLQMGQVIAAPVPGTVIGLVSGYFFGVAWGTLFSVLGTTLGALVAFILARVYGRPLVERWVPPATLERLDAGARRRGLFFFVLIFLLPFLPDDLACFVAGLTSIPIPALMLAVLAGRPPGILVSCWLGAYAVGLSAAQRVLLIAVSALLAGLFLLYGQQLQAWATSLVERLTKDR